MSTGTAERPHTLYIPPAPSVELTGSWGSGPLSPQSPMPVPHPPGLAPSVDSIGSCSLDVNATGTLSPTTMEAIDGSRRSLRSISLDNHLSCGNSPPVTPVRPILKPAPLTDPGGTLEYAVRSHKPPSYLGISCAVSGYSNINRYDSVLREGFRSRDASPARLAFSRSRDSSPMRPEWRVYDPLGQRTSPQATAAKIKELKDQLAKCARELPTFERQGRQGSTRRRDERGLQGRSISVDRGYLTKASDMNGLSTMNSVHNGGPRVHLVEINMNDTTSRKPNNYEYSFERRIVRDGKFEAKESTQYSPNNRSDVTDSPISKSFIQSRIERLYGPSALAAGFRSRRSTLEKERQNSPKPVIPTHDIQKENGGVEWDPETPAPEGMPSVFRHLRPEFRTQLPVRRLGRRGSRDSPTKEGRQIPIQIESTPPSTPEIDIAVVPLPEDIINRTTNNNIIDIKKNKLLNGENSCVDVRDTKINITAKQNGNACMKDNTVHPITSNGDSSEIVNSNVRTNSVSSVNGLVSNSSQINGSPVDDSPKKDNKKVTDSSISTKLVKDGHYFLKVVAEEVAKIEAEVAKIDIDFEANQEKMTEEVRGKVFAGTGKAKLLISQKIKQFCGLCQKNIANDPTEEFPTTEDDLAGFWDMVYIQVEDIWANIRAIHALKENNWVEVKTTKAVSDKTDSARTTQKKSTRPKKAAEKSEETKARDEARKKMMEERRRAMKEAMKAKKAQVEAQNTSDAVEMFVPES